MIMADAKKTRNSSIELLRLLSALAVVVLHYNNENMGGGYKYASPGSAGQLWLLFTESLCICAVNVFIIISAYFLSASKERKLSKIFRLLVQTVVFQLVLYVVGQVLDREPVNAGALVIKCFPAKYYVMLYCTLYVISPFINCALDHLSKKQFRRLLLIATSIFSVFAYITDILASYYGSLTAFNPISINGSQAGYTIVNFMLLYLWGAYIRKFGSTYRIRKILTLFIVLLACGYICFVMEMNFGVHMSSWNYNSPINVMLAVLLLLLFSKLRFSSKIINELAGASFTCYLTHTFFFRFLHIEDAVNAGAFFLILHQIGSVIGIFLICYLIYVLWRWLSGVLLAPLCRLIDRIPVLFPDEE